MLDAKLSPAQQPASPPLRLLPHLASPQQAVLALVAGSGALQGAQRRSRPPLIATVLEPDAHLQTLPPPLLAGRSPRRPLDQPLREQRGSADSRKGSPGGSDENAPPLQQQRLAGTPLSAGGRGRRPLAALPLGQQGDVAVRARKPSADQRSVSVSSPVRPAWQVKRGHATGSRDAENAPPAPPGVAASVWSDYHEWGQFKQFQRMKRSS